MGFCLVAEKIEAKRCKTLNNCFALSVTGGKGPYFSGLKTFKSFIFENFDYLISFDFLSNQTV